MPSKYPSTLANLTLIILFAENLKISKILSSKSKKNCEGKSGKFKNISFVEMKISKLINYSIDMC
jgi:hypothetical protein